MASGSVTVQIESAVEGEKLWKGIVEESHTLIPQLLPEQVAKVAVHGELGVGSVREIIFTDALSKVGFVKEKIKKLDAANKELEYEVIEGGGVGSLWSSAVFSLSLLPKGDGSGTLLSLSFCYDPLPGIDDHESKAKEALEFNSLVLNKINQHLS